MRAAKNSELRTGERRELYDMAYRTKVLLIKVSPEALLALWRIMRMEHRKGNWWKL